MMISHIGKDQAEFAAPTGPNSSRSPTTGQTFRRRIDALPDTDIQSL